MSVIDTLTCDQSTLSGIRESGNFDYYSQKLQPKAEEAVDYANNHVNTSIDGDFIKVIAIILFVLLIAFIIFMMYKNGVFSSKKKGHKMEEEEEQNDDELKIDGIDFEKEIEDAESQRDWNRAVRMIYLQTLQWMSEKGTINWQPHKTPTEYSIEAGITEFNCMTNVFLRTRYGLFDADEVTCQEMHGKQKEMKGGGDEG